MQIIRRKLAMIADSPLDKFIQSMTLSKQLTKNPYGYKYLKSKTNSLDSHIPFPPYLGAERFWISSWWHTEIPLEVLHDWDRERQLFCSVLHHLFGQFVLYHELGHISYHFGGGCHLNVYCTVHQSMWDNNIGHASQHLCKMIHETMYSNFHFNITFIYLCHSHTLHISCKLSTVFLWNSLSSGKLNSFNLM